MNNKLQAAQERIDFAAFEAKWRIHWQNKNLYKTGDDPQKPNIYILDYFPYPSGDGLSVGHCRNYIPTCVSARYYRMNGYNVLHPMGWDAFGLPAENYAVEHGIHPSMSSAMFSATFRRQMKLMECSYDWSREISSSDPSFYRWTQWFFLLLYQRGLAYRAKGRQWFCAHCKTILANEQVEDGRCWRCSTQVVRKELEQWCFKITDYADRLLEDLMDIEWPESIKASQRHWIGRSEGVEITFALDGTDDSQDNYRNIEISVFTTRPDTLYGVTFLTLAPEHPLLFEICSKEQEPAVRAYVQRSLTLSDMERAASTAEKTGVFCGTYAIHPLTGRRIPVWAADYVLPGYGTGAVMGVPGHDQRDLQFADTNALSVITVIRPEDRQAERCYEGAGILIDSGPFTGYPSAEVANLIADELVSRQHGNRSVRYKMRDWLISRQRYWGAPIPIVHCTDCGIVPVPEEDLPVLLPDTIDFRPAGDGSSPLSRVDDWVQTTCPACSGPATRETDTMDGFACSSWYYLRFTSPHYQDGPFDPQAVRRWMPVDSYVGGAEHAVMHLLYSRFWTKVMYDAGLVSFVEPFSTLRNQGMMLSAVDGQKMSKSKGNVVTPDEVVAKYGTDVLRTYILFLGPFDAEVIWDERGIKGITRFLNRYWRLAQQNPQFEGEMGQKRKRRFERRRQQIIKRVTEDVEDFRFNTAVAALMAYVNFLSNELEHGVEPEQFRAAVETVTLLLCPIAPFVTEEVWQTILGQPDSVHRQSWPQYDSEQVKEEQVTVVVQVNGRVRDRLHVEAGIDADSLRTLALDSTQVRRFIHDKNVRKIVVVPDQLVNVVV
ncbi:MAG: leucine--tRNA ligase [Candidatus Promineifilaceae bacterium]|nr:leucine--tRNA ligase [Candidatus Promineifilaceae bacterium]